MHRHDDAKDKGDPEGTKLACCKVMCLGTGVQKARAQGLHVAKAMYLGMRVPKAKRMPRAQGLHVARAMCLGSKVPKAKGMPKEDTSEAASHLPKFLTTEPNLQGHVSPPEQAVQVPHQKTMRWRLPITYKRILLFS
ncbi:hypothetical protein L3X38_038996 [Prunus dulcis]|uniref:Uncharacterized protein n=1 Tax=Prunus dulcis TaxID=3755 RepID=A0AAD4V7D9_PRUDU|nr:hypothetical protein L3X38_038996 [Prunus dulcis]